MAKKAAGTPATVLLTAQKVPHSLHPYEVSPDSPNYGALVAEALEVAPAAVFKTLVAEVDGALTVAVVPVTGDLDLKALAHAAGGKRAALADRARAIPGGVCGEEAGPPAATRAGPAPIHRRKSLPTCCSSMKRFAYSGVRILK